MNLKSIPTWGWVAGGGVVIVGALMLTSKKATSDNSGQSSVFTDTLGQLMTALSNLQSDIGLGGTTPGGGDSGGDSGGGGGSATGSNPASGTASSNPASGDATGSYPALGDIITIAKPFQEVLGSQQIAPTGHLSTSSATASPFIAAKSVQAIVERQVTAPKSLPIPVPEIYPVQVQAIIARLPETSTKVLPAPIYGPPYVAPIPTFQGTPITPSLTSSAKVGVTVAKYPVAVTSGVKKVVAPTPVVRDRRLMPTF